MKNIQNPTLTYKMLGMLLLFAAIQMPGLVLHKINKAFHDLIENGRALFVCCDEDDVDVSINCNQTILPGLNCQICFVKTCNVALMRESINPLFRGSKRLRYAIQLVAGYLFHTFAAQIDTVSWEANVAGEKGANYLRSKIAFKIPGVGRAVNALNPGTMAAFCDMLNKQYILVIQDYNGRRWTLGTPKVGMCVTAGGPTIDKDKNEIRLEFEGNVAVYEYIWALPKA